MTACMGGFCKRRASCAHYYGESREPSERLCLTPSTEAFEPVIARANRVRAAAVQIIEQADAGEAIDSLSLAWARQMLRANPRPKVQPTAETESEPT